MGVAWHLVIVYNVDLSQQIAREWAKSRDGIFVPGSPAW